jgi:hypothetical protein
VSFEPPNQSTKHTRITNTKPPTSQSINTTINHPPPSTTNREEGEFGAALVGKKVRVYHPEQLRYIEVSEGGREVISGIV